MPRALEMHDQLVQRIERDQPPTLTASPGQAGERRHASDRIANELSVFTPPNLSDIQPPLTEVDPRLTLAGSL